MNPQGAVRYQLLFATVAAAYLVLTPTWPFVVVVLALSVGYVGWLYVARYARPGYRKARRASRYRYEDHRAMGVQMVAALLFVAAAGVWGYRLYLEAPVQDFEAWTGLGIRGSGCFLFVLGTIWTLSSATDWYLVLPERDSLRAQEERYCAQDVPEAPFRRRTLTKTWYRHRWIALVGTIVCVPGAIVLFVYPVVAATVLGGTIAMLGGFITAGAAFYFTQASEIMRFMMGQPRLLIGDVATGVEGDARAGEEYLVHSVSAEGLELVRVTDSASARVPGADLNSPEVDPADRGVELSRLRKVDGVPAWRARPCRGGCVGLPGRCPWAAVSVGGEDPTS